MKNLQQGFILPALLVVIALLVIGGGIYVYESKKSEIRTVIDNGTQQSDQQQVNTQTPPVTQPVANTTGKSTQVSDEKNRNDIQDLLRRQCQALSSKDTKALIDTIDQSNASLFQKYKKSVEILLSMTSSVVSCQYEIKDIQFKETTGSLTAEATEKGDLKIKLIDNSIKVIENPNVLIKEKYIFSSNKWRQIISK